MNRNVLILVSFLSVVVVGLGVWMLISNKGEGFIQEPTGSPSQDLLRRIKERVPELTYSTKGDMDPVNGIHFCKKFPCHDGDDTFQECNDKLDSCLRMNLGDPDVVDCYHTCLKTRSMGDPDALMQDDVYACKMECGW